MRVVRTALPVLGAALALCAGLLPAAAQVPAPPSPPPGSPPDREPVDENPCIGELARELRCPDLVMRRPYGLYTDRLTKAGSTVLRAGNVIDSAGAGPAELRGRRVSRRFMDARQSIHMRGGGLLSVDTGARLEFKFAHQQRYWWKFHDAARFELWRLDSRGRRSKLVRTGPKVSYCLRDLSRTRPKMRRSPRRPVYPACSTRTGARRVTLGTSPGWADIYPPAYPEQWIDVTGLRGCFAYVHIADPENGIYESNEDNNEAQVIVRLPFRSGDARRGCHGRDRGRPYNDPALPY
ncbi:MAG TPA: lysyl oxidase family protein [Thermoleophilaceae bacterium]|nr:lysyl oxidase family protein [Thermoleophilaceae bacterium]